MCATVSHSRRRLHPVKAIWHNTERDRYARFVPALANSHRLALVSRLCCEEVGVTELADWLELTQPTVSHHLAILRRAGLVKVRHVGQQRLYRADLDWIRYCCRRLMRQLHVQPHLGLCRNESTHNRIREGTNTEWNTE